MSVLIKGMEMPQGCCGCQFVQSNEIGDDYCLLLHRQIEIDIYDVRREDDCPLVEIKTPHGDLIDVDAIDIYDADSEWDYYNDEYTAFSLTAIKAQTPVIPAEEGEYEYDEE